jgi:hypothetical protein
VLVAEGGECQTLVLKMFFRKELLAHNWVHIPTWLKPDRHIKRSLGVQFAMDIIILMTGAYGKNEMDGCLLEKIHQ